MIKVKENRDWAERFNTQLDRRKRRLRNPLEIGQKVLVLAERAWQDVPGRLFKSKTENKIFFNRDRTFIISEDQNLMIALISIGLKKTVEK